MSPNRRHSGVAFTLAEALLASAVLAMAITAITMPFTAAAQNDQVNARRTVAEALAQEMMEEILAKPFADPQGATVPGPERGETSRNLFDNVDDYDGYVETDGNIADAGGAPLDDPPAAGLSRHVWAAYVYIDGQSPADPPTFVRVVVDVRYLGQPIVTLSRLVYDLR